MLKNFLSLEFKKIMNSVTEDCDGTIAYTDNYDTLILEFNTEKETQTELDYLDDHCNTVSIETQTDLSEPPCRYYKEDDKEYLLNYGDEIILSKREYEIAKDSVAGKSGFRSLMNYINIKLRNGIDIENKINQYFINYQSPFRTYIPIESSVNFSDQEKINLEFPSISNPFISVETQTDLSEPPFVREHRCYDPKGSTKYMPYQKECILSEAEISRASREPPYGSYSSGCSFPSGYANSRLSLYINTKICKKNNVEIYYYESVERSHPHVSWR